MILLLQTRTRIQNVFCFVYKRSAKIIKPLEISRGLHFLKEFFHIYISLRCYSIYLAPKNDAVHADAFS